MYFRAKERFYLKYKKGKKSEQLVCDINAAFDCAGLRRPIIQGKLLPEGIGSNINYITIPTSLIAEFEDEMSVIEKQYYLDGAGQPKTDLKFDLNKMRQPRPIPSQGEFTSINKIETRIAILYFAKSFIDMGYKAIHMGIYWDYSMNQPGFDEGYQILYSVLQKIRDYAEELGTFVLLCGEVPGGNGPDGGLSPKLGGTDNLLFDFDIRAMRPREISNPQVTGDNGHGACEDPINVGPFNDSPCESEQFPAVIDPCVITQFGGQTGGVSPLGCYVEQVPSVIYFDFGSGLFDDCGVTANCTNGPPYEAEGEPSNGECNSVYGYDDSRWFATKLSPECQESWWSHYYCSVRNLLGSTSFLTVPGILPISMPDNFCNTSPDPVASGYFLLADNPGFQASIENSMATKTPSLIVSETCTYYYCDALCEINDLPAPYGYLYKVGRKKYTFSIANTDCSSVYTIHIKKPDGTWVYHNWEQKLSWEYYPKIPGFYTIYIRQDNLGLSDIWGTHQTEDQIFIEPFCCTLIPIQYCKLINLVNLLDITCVQEQSNSIIYDYQINLNEGAFSSVLGIRSISDATDVSDFHFNPITKQITGRFVTYDKEFPAFEAMVDYYKDSNELNHYPILEEADNCFNTSQRNSPSLSVKLNSYEILRVYPNPADNELIIHSGSVIFQNVHITINDLIGRPVIVFPNKSFSGLLHLNISSVVPGIYFLNIKSENGVFEKKIIVI